MGNKNIILIIKRLIIYLIMGGGYLFFQFLKQIKVYEIIT